MAQLNFNAAEIPTSTGDYEPLPAGEYTMQIVDSDMRSTKAGDGQYLFLELNVLGPSHVGRKFFERLNLFNKNPKTVEIANRQLADICRAVGTRRSGRHGHADRCTRQVPQARGPYA